MIETDENFDCNTTAWRHSEKSVVIMQVNQILPSLNYGDAIGNEVLEIRKFLNSLGYKSDIYVQHVHTKLAKIPKRISDYGKVSSSENVMIIHFAIGSDIFESVKSLPDKKILIYHNITPHDFFLGVNESLVDLSRNGRKQLAEFADIVNYSLGDSEYDQRELIELGFKNTGILPILIDFEKYNQVPDQEVLRRYDDDYTNLICVGRLSPNKKQEDIIRIFYYYNKCINPRSRLFLIGSYDGTEKYHVQLKGLIKQLKLHNVFLPGQVDFKELLAYYKLADIFISMSEHEGFCVPLLESMHFGIPIIAYNSTAIPHTLNGTGILVNEKHYEEVAELVCILMNDERVRNRIIEQEKLRLKDFEKSRIEMMLRKYIEGVIS